MLEGLAATGECNCSRTIDVDNVCSDWSEDLVYLKDLGQHRGSGGEREVSRAGRITHDPFVYSVNMQLDTEDIEFVS